MKTKKSQASKLRNFFFPAALILTLAVTLAGLKLSLAASKAFSSKIPQRPANIPLFDFIYSKKHPYGNDQDKILGESVGQTAFIGDLIHRGPTFAQEGDPQVIQLDQSLADQEVKAGSSIELEGTIHNPESYPLIDLQLYGFLFRLEKDSIRSEAFGNHIVKEFLVVKNANLPAKGQEPFRYQLKIPKDIPDGEYAVFLNLVASRRFMVAHSFYNKRLQQWQNPLDSVIFSVKGTGEEKVWLDPATFKLKSIGCDCFVTSFHKEKAFMAIGSPEVEAIFNLVNNFKEDVEVELTYDILKMKASHFGDGGLGMKDFFDDNTNRVTETVALKAGETKEVVKQVDFLASKNNDYGFGNLYSINISGASKNKEAETGIVAYVSLTPGPKSAEFIWPELSKFPIKKGESFNFWTGFVSLEDMFDRIYRAKVEDTFGPDVPEERKGKFEVKLFDRENSEISQLSFDGLINSQERVWLNSAKAEKDLDYVRMVGDFYNEDGLQIDHFEKIYDCEKLGDKICKETMVKSSLARKIIAILIIAASSIAAIYLLTRLFRKI